MNANLKLISKAVVAMGLGAGLLVGTPAQAESTTVTGAGALSTTPCCRLDFAIVIPRVLRFRVGTAGATIDQITFTVPAANLADGSSVAGTGGDAGAGSAANVSVFGNGGQITITETNNSGGNGLKHASLAEYISYGEITTTSGDANLPRPVLSDGGGNTSAPVLNTGNVTNRSTIWTYAYNNPLNVFKSAGTYGTAANGGQVTYTATMP